MILTIVASGDGEKSGWKVSTKRVSSVPYAESKHSTSAHLLNEQKIGGGSVESEL